MILTHPLLFNTIVIVFIAVTSGWVVSVINSKRSIQLKTRIRELEHEKEQAGSHIRALEERLEKRFAHPVKSTPVITLSSSPVKVNKTS
jgi:hypothetical protein